MTPVLHYPLLEPHNARGIPPSEASCKDVMRRRAIEHTTARHRAPHSFWRRRPKRRPFHTQPLVFSTIQRGGLRFKLHNTSSRGLTAVRRGNCIIRDLTRRRHAASQLPMLQNPHTRRHGRRRVADKTRVQRRVARKNSPSTSHMPPVPVQNSPCASKMALFGTFCAHRANFIPLPPTTSPTRHQLRYITLPARAARCHLRYKTRPTRPTRQHFRYKTRPARPKWPHLARFPLAGRVLSRFCRQQAKHGEFCPAQTPTPTQD